MKDKINSYFAILLITIAGSGAVYIIVDVATTNVVTSVLAGGNEANYAALQQSILKNHRTGL